MEERTAVMQIEVREPGHRVFADGEDTGLIFREPTAEESDLLELGPRSYSLERTDGATFTPTQMAVLRQLSGIPA